MKRTESSKLKKVTISSEFAKVYIFYIISCQLQKFDMFLKLPLTFKHRNNNVNLHYLNFESDKSERSIWVRELYTNLELLRVQKQNRFPTKENTDLIEYYKSKVSLSGDGFCELAHQLFFIYELPGMEKYQKIAWSFASKDEFNQFWQEIYWCNLRKVADRFGKDWLPKNSERLQSTSYIQYVDSLLNMHEKKQNPCIPIQTLKDFKESNKDFIKISETAKKFNLEKKPDRNRFFTEYQTTKDFYLETTLREKKKKKEHLIKQRNRIRGLVAYNKEYPLTSMQALQTQIGDIFRLWSSICDESSISYSVGGRAALSPYTSFEFLEFKSRKEPPVASTTTRRSFFKSTPFKKPGSSAFRKKDENLAVWYEDYEKLVNPSCSEESKGDGSCESVIANIRDAFQSICQKDILHDPLTYSEVETVIESLLKKNKKQLSPSAIKRWYTTKYTPWVATNLSKYPYISHLNSPGGSTVYRIVGKNGEEGLAMVRIVDSVLKTYLPCFQNSTCEKKYVSLVKNSYSVGLQSFGISKSIKTISKAKLGFIQGAVSVPGYKLRDVTFENVPQSKICIDAIRALCDSLRVKMASSVENVQPRPKSLLQAFFSVFPKINTVPKLEPKSLNEMSYIEYSAFRKGKGRFASKCIVDGTTVFLSKDEESEINYPGVGEDTNCVLVGQGEGEKRVFKFHKYVQKGEEILAAPSNIAEVPNMRYAGGEREEPPARQMRYGLGPEPGASGNEAKKPNRYRCTECHYSTDLKTNLTRHIQRWHDP